MPSLTKTVTGSSSSRIKTIIYLFKMILLNCHFCIIALEREEKDHLSNNSFILQQFKAMMGKCDEECAMQAC